MKPIDIPYKTADELQITENELQKLIWGVEKLLSLGPEEFSMRTWCSCIAGVTGLGGSRSYSQSLARLFLPLSVPQPNACWDHSKQSWDATPDEAAKAVVRFLQGE